MPGLWETAPHPCHGVTVLSPWGPAQDPGCLLGQLSTSLCSSAEPAPRVSWSRCPQLVLLSASPHLLRSWTPRNCAWSRAPPRVPAPSRVCSRAVPPCLSQNRPPFHHHPPRPVPPAPRSRPPRSHAGLRAAVAPPGRQGAPRAAPLGQVDGRAAPLPPPRPAPPSAVFTSAAASVPPPSLPLRPLPPARPGPARSLAAALRSPRQCGAAAPRPAPAMDTSDLFTSCKKGDVSRVR